MNQSPAIILAIESGVAGGSFTILRPEREAISVSGNSELSRAETLLSDLQRALSDNDLSKLQIEHIAVSAGPGSFTGIRIGIATALGLAAALKARMSSHSILAVMAAASEPALYNRETISLIPMGRGSIAIQRFRNDRGTIIELSDILIMPNLEDCVTYFQGEPHLVVHSSLETALSDLAIENATIQAISELSLPLAKYAAANPDQQSEPLFISRQL